MKKEGHPQYQNVSIRCACGNVIETRSTLKGVVQVDLCSSCHPFFTGTQKLIDTAGRIDRFKKKFEKTAAVKTASAAHAVAQAAAKSAKTEKKK